MSSSCTFLSDRVKCNKHAAKCTFVCYFFLSLNCNFAALYNDGWTTNVLVGGNATHLETIYFICLWQFLFSGDFFFALVLRFSSFVHKMLSPWTDCAVFKSKRNYIYILQLQYAVILDNEIFMQLELCVQMMPFSAN